MTKENWIKITTPFSSWGISEISVSEKKILQENLAEKGFSQSTFYLRFFQKGFSEWELSGIKNLKIRFLRLINEQNIEAGNINTDDTFYESLGQTKGLRNMFISFMQERGMSAATVIKRFTLESWRPWEQEGIRAVLEPFVEK
nr:MAG TPA: hypothetical protein [Caudoviricetes sp.]